METKLQEIEVSKLKKARYQRQPQDSRVSAMAKAFDPLLVGAIVVSFRDGEYWVVTGQHRMLAARRAGIPTLPAVIHYGLTYEREAEVFAKNATTTKPVGQVDLHRARLEQKDPQAIAVQDALHRAGFLGFATGGGRKDALTSVRIAYRLHKQGVLDCVLGLVNLAWKRDNGYLPGALKGSVLRAIGDFLVRYPGHDPKRLEAVLSVQRPTDLIPAYGHPSGGPEAWRILLGWYNGGLRSGRLDEAA